MCYTITSFGIKTSHVVVTTVKTPAFQSWTDVLKTKKIINAALFVCILQQFQRRQFSAAAAGAVQHQETVARCRWCEIYFRQRVVVIVVVVEVLLSDFTTRSLSIIDHCRCNFIVVCSWTASCVNCSMIDKLKSRNARITLIIVIPAVNRVTYHTYASQCSSNLMRCSCD